MTKGKQVDLLERKGQADLSKGALADNLEKIERLDGHRGLKHIVQHPD